MEGKLKCIIVDDEPEAHVTLRELVSDSPIAEITEAFYKPSDLLDKLYTLEADVFLLDLVFLNDKLQGLDIAPKLKEANKLIIFISGKNEMVLEACRWAGAVDVIPKPNTKGRLWEALMKAWRMHPANEGHELHEKSHALFHLAGKREMVNLYLADIYYVRTINGEPRNKEVILKNGKKAILMNYSFEQLHKLCERLVRINESEMVSYDMVGSVGQDTVYTKPDIPPEIPKWLTLSRTYRKTFKDNFR